MYSIGAYYLSKNMIELPTAIVMPGVQLFVIYFAVGYRADNWIPELFQVWLLAFLLVQCALSYGYFVSCSVNKMESATAVAPLLTMPAIMFGGFFANSNSYVNFIAWLKYISPVYYANCGILISNWKTNYASPNYNFALDLLVGDQITYSECVWGMVALALFWRVLSFIGLKRGVTKFQ